MGLFKIYDQSSVQQKYTSPKEKSRSNPENKSIDRPSGNKAQNSRRARPSKRAKPMLSPSEIRDRVSKGLQKMNKGVKPEASGHHINSDIPDGSENK